MTEDRQSFDPYRLIDEVTELLRDHGLAPELEAGHTGAALAGAGQLLRALGVQPLMDAGDSFERSASRVWAEEDGLR